MSNLAALEFSSAGYFIGAFAAGVGTSPSLAYMYNLNGTLIGIRNGEGQVTSFVTGTNGITSLVDPGSRTWSLGYDGASTDNLSSYALPGSPGSFAFHYDSSHDLTQIVDPNGDVTNIAYVGSGSSAAVASITRVVNGVNDTWTFTYNSGSTVVTDPNGHTNTYAYDSAGRVTAATDALSHTTSTTWTSDNQVATTTTPNGIVTTNVYGWLNCLTSTTVSKPGGSSLSTTIACIDQNWPYKPTSVTDTQGNATGTSYNWTDPVSVGALLVLLRRRDAPTSREATRMR